MSDLLRKLQYLQATKEEIKQSIINKGVSVDTDIPFRQYPNLISEFKSKQEVDGLLEDIDKQKENIVSIINKLNNKFGTDIPTNAGIDIILSSIDEIIMTTVFCRATIKSKMNYDDFNMKTNINMITKAQKTNNNKFTIKDKMDYLDFNMEVRKYVEN